MLIPFSGAKCGSINIDKAFKRWLRDYIGEKYYRQLDGNPDVEKISFHTTEGQAMRELMRQFEIRKKNFCMDTGDSYIDLPAPLHNITIAGKVEEGQIKISR